MEQNLGTGCGNFLPDCLEIGNQQNWYVQYLHPVAITLGRQGRLLFIDVNPLNQSSRLVKADIHNLVCLEVVKSELPDVLSVCSMNEVGAAILCQ